MNEITWAQGAIAFLLLLIVVGVSAVVVSEDKIMRRIRKQEAARARWACMMADDIERACMFHKEQK